MNKNIAIEVTNATKSFDRKSLTSIRDTVFHLIGQRQYKTSKNVIFSDISFEVQKGEVFGIIGKNGSGKSTLLKSIIGAIKLDKGTIESDGKMIRLALGQGFDPDMTARQNIYLLGSLLGLSFAEIGERFREIVEFADVHDYVDMEVKYYSTGMKNRLSFAVSQYVEADIFLMDEFFTGVGDVNFKKKSFEVFQNNIVNESTVVFVSHNLKHLEKFCHRLMLLFSGEIVDIGEPGMVIEKYENLMEKYGK